jgi:RimJ/RimL family protein N-acetyltransferase
VHLLSDRLLLREFVPDDFAAVHAFASDPVVVLHTDWGPNDPDDTRAFLTEAITDAAAEPRSRFALGVVRRATGSLVGSAELRVTADRRGEIGYVLSRAEWGHGFGTEAAGTLLGLGFRDLGLLKITATCSPRNLASTTVLTRIGMRQEGYLRDHLWIRGQWEDRLLFGVLASGPTGRG